MNNRTLKMLFICGAAFTLLASAGPAVAQVPDEFTNLKILPEDIGKRQLVSMMRDVSAALGEGCDFCHAVQTDTPGRLDFASDDLEHKRVARAMMKMTQEINQKLLPATGRSSPVRVRCVTCHRGVEKPESLDRILMSVAEKESVSAAAERYDELREKYYGKGSYDFGPRSLNAVAEKLAQEANDVEGAVELMKLNVERNPDAAETHLLLGQLYDRKGDKKAAIASLERAVELEPDNRWAKQTLERVRSSD
jgi:tetratricopeptide (TPR) repeat protein